MITVKNKKIKIQDLVDGFVASEEGGVRGYHGKLNIRPAFQREFVYNEKQEAAVIDSVLKGFPLNGMYWIKNDNNTYELIDGQQRTLSICYYYVGNYFITKDKKLLGFWNLSEEDRNKFLNYELLIYVCENATNDEKLDWFRVINTVGEKLTAQELRNALYTGTWISDARRRFAKRNTAVDILAKPYLTGSILRQDYWEKTLDWISDGNIEEYMAKHQHDENADIEYQYFNSVISWVKNLFPKYRTIMKGVEWGALYNKYKDLQVSATELEKRISDLLIDDDVTKKKGVYEYILTGNEKALSIRTFSEAMKIATYERQNGVCIKCGRQFDIADMEADHITPWSKGGHTTSDNCQMLCKDCNRTKSNR